MGAALTRGVQKHAMACGKHFALNSMENARFKVDVSISPRALHEIYLPHFKRLVEEGVASIMSAYNSVNGEWCGQNKVLLTDILKNKWGFKGFVMTDFTFGMRDAKKAALAGQDLEMPFHMHFHQHLKGLVDAGEVPIERINDAVLRLLRQQLRLLHPGEYGQEQIGSAANRQVARQAAEKSIVLLQNKAGFLPLKSIKKLAVIGRLANTPNTGDAGSSNTRPASVITPLEGIRMALEGQAEVQFEDGSDLERAKAAAREADAVVLVVGYTHLDEGEFLDPAAIQNLVSLFPPPTPEEIPIQQSLIQGLAGGQTMVSLPSGDRSSLTLLPQDEILIDAVASVQSHTVVAVMGGSAVIMEAWKEKVASILMLWYPGMEGGHALADILLGKVNPSGKLPLVIPTQAEHLPFFDKNAEKITYDLWHGYRMLERDGNQPAFPFGFGLSYTRYRYANLKLARKEIGPSETLRVSLDVSNIGAQAGEEVVQLYVSSIESAVERAPKELKAFTRIAVEPGESRTIQFDLAIPKLAYYDETREDFIVEPVEYELFVGAHSLDQQALKALFRVRSV
jgi:beta-glucosidase